MAKPASKPMQRAPRKEHTYVPTNSSPVSMVPEPVEVKRKPVLEVFSTRLHPELVRDVKRSAFEREISVQEAVSEALKDWLRK